MSFSKYSETEENWFLVQCCHLRYVFEMSFNCFFIICFSAIYECHCQQCSIYLFQGIFGLKIIIVTIDFCFFLFLIFVFIKARKRTEHVHLEYRFSNRLWFLSYYLISCRKLVALFYCREKTLALKKWHFSRISKNCLWHIPSLGQGLTLIKYLLCYWWWRHGRKWCNDWYLFHLRNPAGLILLNLKLVDLSKVAVLIF